MTSSQEARPSGCTRWARFALVMVPTLGLSGLMLGALATGALAASFGVSANSFTVSGQSFQFSADRLTNLISDAQFSSVGGVSARSGTVAPSSSVEGLGEPGFRG